MPKKDDEKKKEESEETALATVDKKKLEAEVVLYTGSKEISAELEKAQTLGKHDFYKVGNKTVPSARALQWLANRKQIKTMIVDIKSDAMYCRAVVGGWIGENPDPKGNPIYKEATVEMMFDIEIAEKVLEWIPKFNLQKGVDYDIDSATHAPVLINPKLLHRQMKEMLRLRKFALRTVVTKAERIIHSKLADVEWRDEDEMDDEKKEVEMVSGKKTKDTKEEKPKPKSESKQESKSEDEDVEEAEYTDIPEEKVKKEPVDELHEYLKDKLEIEKDMSPREALKAIDDAAFPNYAEGFKALVLEFCPNYFDDSLSRWQIPESACKAIVKKVSGVNLKLVEKTPTCKKKSCKEKLTEPEAEEHEGYCQPHWQEKNDD